MLAKHHRMDRGSSIKPARQAGRLKRVAAVAACAIGLPMAAHAQSSVQIYGLMDVGVDYNTNVGGARQTSMGTGVLSPNLWGFKGVEDLGGGLSAEFRLESQFNVGTGALTGNMFGRQAYVGLTDKTWGSVKLGNQYDFMFTSLAVKRYGPMFGVVSLQNLRQGPFNALGVPSPISGAFDFDRVAGEQINNAVKYESPDLAGLNFGAMYGFGNKAGSFGQDSSQSFSVDYGFGPVQLDAAYTYVKYASIDGGNAGIRNWGLGGRTKVWDVFVDLLYTSTTNTYTGGHVDVFETGAMLPFGNAWNLVGAYQFMKGNATLDNYKAHQVNVTLDYSLSKRTDLYTSATWQHAIGNGAQAQIILFGPSDGANQMAFRIGMRHFF